MSYPTIPTSKKNAIASLRKHINDNVITGFVGEFATDTNSPYLFYQNYAQITKFPSLAMIERPIPQLSPTAFDDNLGNQHGTIQQFLMEFNIQDMFSSDLNPSAEKNVLLIRERLWHALYNAGQTDDLGNVIMPNIKLLDFDNAQADTNSYVWWPNEESNSWFETPYLAEEANPSLKRMQIAVRFRWVSVTDSTEIL